MKSHFSRFLHITSSYSGLTRISRWKKFATWFDLDTPVKPDNDSLCAGRSMVEMLGVLAIIGVLSVGAIAGYSKAMFKYKLNQHAQAVNMLINNALSIKDQLQHKLNATTYYGTLLHKMNLLPDGIEYISDTTLKEKYFNSNIMVYYMHKEGFEDFGGIEFSFNPTAQGAEVCRNIAFAAKENAANLWELETYKYFNDTTSGDGKFIGHIYGDSYCTEEKSCLRDLDLNKIEKLCNDCNEKRCMLYVLWENR